MNFQDKPSRNPNNYNILKGGQVDPASKLYQRSVAGRQKLEDYVKDLWDQGKDEKDVFMAAVKSLMSRGHGYVGAYLDSKNPGRRYTKPQAMKIADEVMKNAGIGSHPGARLTSAKDDEEREARRDDRTQRREARKYGPAPAPAQKAKPVGQQRKEGGRTGTEPVAEDDTRRSRIGEPANGPVSEWQKTLKDRMKGEASTQDVLAAFQKQYQSKLSGSPQAKEQRKKKRAEDRERETAAPGVTDEEIATPEEKAKWKAPGEGREDRSSVEEAKTGVAGASGGMLSAQSTPVIGPWSRNEKEYKQSITDTFDRLLNQEIQFQYDDIKGIRDPKQKNSIRNKIYSDPKELEYIFKDTIYDFISKDDSLKGTDFDKFARDHLNRLVAFRTGQEIEPETPIQQPPLEEAKRTAQDRQAQVDIPREPDPWEGEPSKRIDPTQVDTSTGAKPQAALPPARSPRKVSSKGGFRPGKQPIREKPGGFGGPRKVTPEQKKDIAQAAAESKSVEDFKARLYRENLFDMTGYETGSALTNPLEDSPPDPYEKFRGDPAPEQTGAQAGGRELPTVGRGGQGQGSLLKMDKGKQTMDVRQDFRKGSKPEKKGGSKPGNNTDKEQGQGQPEPVGTPPTPPIQTEEERTRQIPLDLRRSSATKEKMQQQQGIKQKRIEKETAKINREASKSSKKERFNWVPDPENPETGRWVPKRKGRKPKPPSQTSLPFDTAETGKLSYDEFAQSIRSMMR